MKRYNPGVQLRQPGFGKTEKTEFTGAGILRDAEKFSSGRQTGETEIYITMKFKTLIMSFMLSAVTIGAFASTVKNVSSEPLPYHQIKAIHAMESIVSKPTTSTCTVTVKIGKISSTVTTTCECTQREACAAAYKLATIIL